MKSKNRAEMSDNVIEGGFEAEKKEQISTKEVLFSTPKKQKLSPYFNAYMAAYGIKRVEPEAFKPYGDYVRENEEIIPQEQILLPAPIETQKVEVKKKKSKRSFFIVLVLILSCAILALNIISVFGYADFFTLPLGDEEVTFGNDDIINSLTIFLNETFKGFEFPKFIEGSTQYYYNVCLSTFGEQDMLVKIAIICFPAFMIFVTLMSLISVIKCLVALFGKKRRKLTFIPLMTFLGAISFMLFGFLLRGSTNIADIVKYLIGPNGIQISIFMMILLAAAFVNLFLSLFTYKKDENKALKKKEKKAAKLAAKQAKSNAQPA